MKLLSFLADWVPRLIGGTCLLLVCILIGANLEYSAYSQYYRDHVGEPHATEKYLQPSAPWNFFKETVSDTGDYWTAIASLVGMLALWGIYEQIAETRKANEAANRSAQASESANAQTTRSVDAFINSTKGCMAYECAEINRYATEIYCAFKNVGAGPCFVRSISIGFSRTPSDWSNTNGISPMRMFGINSVLCIGNIKQYERIREGYKIMDIPQWINDERPAEGGGFYVVFYLNYDTMVHDRTIVLEEIKYYSWNIDEFVHVSSKEVFGDFTTNIRFLK